MHKKDSQSEGVKGKVLRMGGIIKKIFWGTPVRKAFSLLTVLLILPAWVFNFENWMTVNGYDSLLTDSESPVLKAIGCTTAFLLSSAPRWFFGGAIFAFVADGIWRFFQDEKKIPPSHPVAEQIAPMITPEPVLPDPKIAQLQGELDKSKHKIEMLAAAEKARLDLALVPDLLGAIDACPKVTPMKFSAEGAPRRAYYQVSHLVSQIRNATYRRDAWNGFGEAIASAVAALDSNHLNFVAEEHERPIFGTNAGKKAFMIAKATVDGARTFVKNKEAEMMAVIKSAADLKP